MQGPSHPHGFWEACSKLNGAEIVVSLQIRTIFAEYTRLIEPLSLDEAYLDVTENLQGIASAMEIAQRIKAKIRTQTQLTASAGISYNKFLAKLATDHRKPDGLFVITPAMGPSFVETLSVERFHGVGPATAAKMNQLGNFHGNRSEGEGRIFPEEAFWKGRPAFLFDLPRHRSQASPCRSRSQIDRC
jgi:DNA polymerase IV